MAKDRGRGPSETKPPFRIADAGRRSAAGVFDRTHVCFNEVMNEIEREVERDGGLYRKNKGRITLKEVADRAGYNGKVLYQPRHHKFKAVVDAWLTRVNSRLIKGARSIGSEITERVERADEVAHAIRQAWCEAELEYVEGRNEVARLVEENARLSGENARLRAELAGQNVVPIKGGKP